MIVRITAIMRTEIVAREQVHLDSILMAHHPDRDHHLDRRSPVTAIRQLPLPIFHIEGVPMCSAWELGDHQAALQHIVKRKDAFDIEQRSRPWSSSSGPEKNYMVPLPTALAASVCWYVIGDRRGILELLRHVKQIGAVRRHGYGIVACWTAETVGMDPIEVVLRPDGTARRFLPARWTTRADAIERGPVAPPYWHPAMVTDRVRPGVRCELRQDIVDRIRQCR
jgi:hypothetical protein